MNELPYMPCSTLKDELDLAVQEERYEDAAYLHGLIEAGVRPTGEKPPFLDLHEVYRDQEEALVVKRIKKLKMDKLVVWTNLVRIIDHREMTVTYFYRDRQVMQVSYRSGKPIYQ
mgnify:FL=1